MRIGIIGAGRVGVTMGKYLGDAGVEVSGFYSKTYAECCASSRIYRYNGL